MTGKGKFTDLLNAAKEEKTKGRKEEIEKENNEQDTLELPDSSVSDDDPIVNLNLKVPRSVRNWVTISARELNLSNKDLIINAVTEYVKKTKGMK